MEEDRWKIRSPELALAHERAKEVMERADRLLKRCAIEDGELPLPKKFCEKNDWIDRRSTKRKGLEPKIQSPFPEDEKDKIIWLLNTISVSPHRISVSIYCYIVPDIAIELTTWLASNHNVSNIHKARQHQKIRLSFGVNFAPWLATKANEHGLDVAKTIFHISWEEAKKKIELFYRKRDEICHVILEKVYARDGRRGCYDCGRENDVLLEFDHNESSKKNDEVSHLLSCGRWEEAETEGMKCNIRCRHCHTKKSIVTNASAGAPRKPVSEDKKVEAERDYARKINAKRHEHGKQRLRNAKLTLAKCVRCNKTCNLDTIHDFEFDHIDETAKKRNVSQMNTASDKVFFAELSKCQLLCTFCHRERTQEQRKRGAFTALYEQKKRKKD